MPIVSLEKMCPIQYSWNLKMSLDFTICLMKNSGTRKWWSMFVFLVVYFTSWSAYSLPKPFLSAENVPSYVLYIRLLSFNLIFNKRVCVFLRSWKARIPDRLPLKMGIFTPGWHRSHSRTGKIANISTWKTELLCPRYRHSGESQRFLPWSRILAQSRYQCRTHQVRLWDKW